MNRTLSDAMVRSLIEKGKSGKLQFGNEGEGPFEGRLILADKNTGKLELERL